MSLRDYRDELDGSPAGARPVADADRRAAQEAIRRALTDLARFYKLEQAPGPSAEARSHTM